MLRDRIAQVLPEWDAKTPDFASLLAMYAFGLEENGQYRQAERAARRALALDPRHPGAIHVVAHVLEMEGRAREGLAFLDATEAAWAHGTGYLRAPRVAQCACSISTPTISDAALAAYDEEIVGRARPDMNSLADASALLWRLWLRNVEVADRWRSLADRWGAAAAGRRAALLRDARDHRFRRRRTGRGRRSGSRRASARGRPGAVAGAFWRMRSRSRSARRCSPSPRGALTPASKG